ncbi:MAG: ATPase [Clostridia bacterium]|nr:ATPase [Clostridia bacterium]
MEILELIEVLEDKIDQSMTIPFWGKGIIDKDELMDMLQEIRVKFPEEMKQAKWIKEERQRIIADAQKEAAAIIQGAEDKIVALINEHEITKQAYEQANSIIEKAQSNSHEIRLGANQYADDLLRQVEEELVAVADTIRNNRKELKK